MTTSCSKASTSSTTTSWCRNAKEGLNRIRIKRWDGSADVYIPFNDPAYTAYVGANPDFNTEKFALQLRVDDHAQQRA